MKNILSLKYTSLLIFLLFAVSLFALPKTQASLAMFIFFDISWLLLLANILLSPKYYVYFFSAAMLFLGFWVKYLSLLLFNIQLIEPVGFWWQLQSKQNWDQVLFISTLIALGLLSANICLYFFRKMGRKNETNPAAAKRREPPQWYKDHRISIWILFLAFVFTVNAINFFGQVSVTGVITKWHLPFHLNAVISLILSLFIPLFMAALIHWDNVLQTKNRKKLYFIIPLIACISSITTLSRCVYIFWILPYLFVFLCNKFPTNPKQLISFLQKNKLIILWYIAWGIFSLLAVSLTRAYYYQYSVTPYVTPYVTKTCYKPARLLNKPLTFEHYNTFYTEIHKSIRCENNDIIKTIKKSKEYTDTYTIFSDVLPIFSIDAPVSKGAHISKAAPVSKDAYISKLPPPTPISKTYEVFQSWPILTKIKERFSPIKTELNQLLSLFVGRWVGLEAIMATTVYPSAGMDLFFQGLKELPKHDGVGMYSEKILGLNYNFAPGRLLASLPGLPAILNYSHSPLLVFSGIYLTILFICLLESFSFQLLRNELLLVQQAIIIAYWGISGLNIPYLGLINILEVLMISILIASLGPIYLRIKIFEQHLTYLRRNT